MWRAPGRRFRAARLELWQSPSATELLASLGTSPIEKKAQISPFLDFLGGRKPKNSVSDDDSAALQNWVIRRLTKQVRLVKNPSIATRRDTAPIAALCAAPARGNSKMAGKLPQNRGPRSASVGHVYRGTMLRYLLALLACLERAAGPPYCIGRRRYDPATLGSGERTKSLHVQRPRGLSPCRGVHAGLALRCTQAPRKKRSGSGV